MTRVLLLAALLAAVLASPAAAAVAPGRVVLPNGNPAPVANVDAAGALDAAALPDGGIVLAGSRQGGGAIVTRLGADGTPHPAFGRRGTAVLDLPAFRFFAGRLLRDSDGRLLLVGAAEATERGQTERIALARLLGDGRPDASFGRGGIVVTPIQASCGGCTPVALGPDGSVLVTGHTGRVSLPPADPASARGFRWVLTRLGATGAPDPGFGGDGLVEVPGVAVDDSGGYGVAVAPQGRIVLLGRDGRTSVLTALTPDGAADPGFAGGRPAPVPASAFELALRAGGPIDVLGLERLVRFTASGARDGAFGAAGAVELGRSGSRRGMIALPDGGTLIVQQTSYEPVLAGQAPLRVRRLAPDGRLAATGPLAPAFGGGLAGAEASPRLRSELLRPHNSFGGGLLRRADGSFLAFGGVRVVRYTGEGAGFSSGHFAVAAFTPFLQADRRFGGRQAPAWLNVNVPHQRARTAARKRRVLVRITASGPGLALLRVRDDRRRILAQAYEPIHATGTTTVHIGLTTLGRRVLARGGRRVEIGHAFRDVLTSRDGARVGARLR